jgi:NAD(P)-dependent dehydrogenase (short-subunit alcohol dehydrogenase family)
MSMGRLDGTVAVITGASRGLGHDMALGFAAEGAAVALAARTVEPTGELPGSLAETTEEIRSRGGVAEAFVCDVRAEADLVALVEGTRERLGPIDVLVNNAALTIPGRPGTMPAAPSESTGVPGLLDFPLRAYQRAFEVNTWSAYRLMQLVLPDMVAAGHGSVINISSDAAHFPGQGPWEHTGHALTYAYGGSKAALEHLTQCAAYEFAPAGIAINALLTSRAMDTPGVRVMMSGYAAAPTETFVEAAVRLAVAKPEEVTGQSVYHEDLLSDGPPKGWQGGLGDGN